MIHGPCIAPIAFVVCCLLTSCPGSTPTLELYALSMTASEGRDGMEMLPNRVAAPKLDAGELQRWSSNETNLLPGREMNVRDASAWERYRAEIILICVALFAQAGLIGWLIYEHRRRHQAEILARSSMAELAHMNRVAAAGELSSSVAHEVSQPLTGITTRANAALRWLSAETPNLEGARAALTQIVAASDRASDIITSVRAMFEKGVNERAPVSINHLIASVLTILRVDLLKNRVVVQLELDERVPDVLGDKVQLQQVLLNLIMNAIEAMKSAQTRVLTVRTRSRNPNSVEVSIEDTGIGIDPANLERIFKPLFTTKERGMGVGLAICNSIIESHNGRIWVSSAATDGSIFEFELPGRVRDDERASESVPLTPISVEKLRRKSIGGRASFNRRSSVTTSPRVSDRD